MIFAVVLYSAAVGTALIALPLPAPWLIVPALMVGAAITYRAWRQGSLAINSQSSDTGQTIISVTDLTRTALATYLYKRWVFNEDLALVVSSAYLALNMVVMLISTADGPEGRGPELLIGVTTLFASLFLTIPIGQVAHRSVEWFWISAASRSAIEEHSNSADRPTLRLRPHRLADPYGRRRELARIGGLLEQLATRYDRTVPVGARPQPIATLLRACVKAVNSHLTSFRSFATTTPNEIREILRLVYVILAGSVDDHNYADLSGLVHAFGADGAPLEATVGPALKRDRLARRIVDAVEATHRAALAAAGILVVITSIYLLLTGKIDVCGYTNQEC